MMSKPKIIVLCGSSRYCMWMSVAAWLLERDEGAITMGLNLLPYWYPEVETIPDHLAEHEGVADAMDELHLRKLDLADEVFVLNKDDYIGDSTRRELEYAKNLGLPIRWYTHDPVGQVVEKMWVDWCFGEQERSKKTSSNVWKSMRFVKWVAETDCMNSPQECPGCMPCDAEKFLETFTK